MATTVAGWCQQHPHRGGIPGHSWPRRCKAVTPTLGEAQAQAEGDQPAGVGVKLGVRAERLVLPQRPACKTLVDLLTSRSGHKADDGAL